MSQSSSLHVSPRYLNTCCWLDMHPCLAAGIKLRVRVFTLCVCSVACPAIIAVNVHLSHVWRSASLLLAVRLCESRFSSSLALTWRCGLTNSWNHSDAGISQRLVLIVWEQHGRWLTHACIHILPSSYQFLCCCIGISNKYIQIRHEIAQLLWELLKST